MAAGSMKEEPLSVKGLRREFEQNTVALADLSFEVHAGEVVGLLGANGAGKTTAMNIILGLMQPTAGTVRPWHGPVQGPHRHPAPVQFCLRIHRSARQSPGMAESHRVRRIYGVKESPAAHRRAAGDV